MNFTNLNESFENKYKVSKKALREHKAIKKAAADRKAKLLESVKKTLTERYWRLTVPGSYRAAIFTAADEDDMEQVKDSIIAICDYVIDNAAKTRLKEDELEDFITEWEDLKGELEYQDFEDEEEADYWLDEMYDLMDNLDVFLGLEESLKEDTILNPGGHYQPEYEKEIKQRLRSFLFNKGYDTDSEEVKNYISAAAELIGYSPDEYSVEEWYKDTMENYPEDLAALPKLSKKFRKALQSDPDLDYIRYGLEYGDDDFDESLNEESDTVKEPAAGNRKIVTKSDYEGALWVMKHSTKEKDIRVAQNAIRRYREQQKKTLGEDMYRQYEDPYALEDEYNQLKAYYNMHPDEKDDYAEERLASLSDRINFAWQDDEYDSDYYRDEFYSDLYNDPFYDPEDDIQLTTDDYNAGQWLESLKESKGLVSKLKDTGYTFKELKKMYLSERGYPYDPEHPSLKKKEFTDWLKDFVGDKSLGEGFKAHRSSIDLDEVGTDLWSYFNDLDESNFIEIDGPIGDGVRKISNGEEYAGFFVYGDKGSVKLILTTAGPKIKYEIIPYENRKALVDKVPAGEQYAYDLEDLVNAIKVLDLNNLDESYKRKKKNLKGKLDESWSGVFSVRKLMQEFGIDKNSAKKLSDYLYDNSYDDGFKHQDDALDFYRDEIETKILPKITVDESLKEGLDDGEEDLAETYRQAIIDWMYDHPQALRDIQSQMGVGVEDVSLNGLKAWVAQHKQLKADFENYFHDELDESCGKKKKLDELVAGRKLTGGSMGQDDRAVIQPIIDAIAAFEEGHENEFFITWNFGRRASDNKMTAGVDINFSGPSREDEEQKEAYVDELLDVINQNGYIMDPALGYDKSGPREGIFGGFHYQIVEAGEDPDFFNEAVEEDDDFELDTTEQEFTSADTSINKNKLPAVFKMTSFEPGTINIDYGGGKFDNATEYLAQSDVTNLVYDPFNRSKEHNSDVIKQVRANGGADSATCSNVLNVIKEPEARLNVLRNIKKLVKPGGTVYITVYEGSGIGNEGPTKAGYQLNRKTADYLEEIQAVFPDARRKGKLIIATNSDTNESLEDEADETKVAEALDYSDPMEDFEKYVAYYYYPGFDYGGLSDDEYYELEDTYNRERDRYNQSGEERPWANMSLTEDTIKQNSKWVNKGKEGTHGKFNTKKEADAQRKAMFANKQPGSNWGK